MFEIFVNGQVFTLWEECRLRRSLDQNAGQFDFRSSGRDGASYPVKAGDEIKVMINGVPRLTGFCEVVRGYNRNGASQIIVGGRDNVCDLIDSSLPDEAKSLEGALSMKEICEATIAALGADIPVTDTLNLPAFSDLESFSSDAGRNAMDFLTAFARKKQAYLISDGKGGLVIYRPRETIIAGQVINSFQGGGNVIQSQVDFDHTKRFYEYSIRSQDNYGADEDADIQDGVDRQGVSFDSAIRKSRFFEVQGEESMDDATAVDRSKEEMNIRRARSTEYQATVQGVERAPGIQWDIGQLTKVRDDFFGLRGIFVTRAISMQVSKSGGTTTDLIFAPPEAYNVRVPTQKDARRAKQGDVLQ